jgi:uncharacterized membrane protein YhaH (DUF805 family)
VNLLALLLSFHGRINRARYWLGVLAMSVLVALVIGLVVVTRIPAVFLGMIPIFYMSLALAAKRLHDRNKSGWWVVVFIVLPGILDRLSNRVVEESVVWWVLVLPALALSIWGLVEIGFRRGTAGSNDHGPDPLARTEPVAVNP